jgi:hypothetical protein
MKFRAIRRNQYGEHACGPARRSFPAALADARHDIDPMRARISTWIVRDSKGREREISETQLDRGIGEYHNAIAHRDAVGVWG